MIDEPLLDPGLLENALIQFRSVLDEYNLHREIRAYQLESVQRRIA